jgi:hypothetical protein
MGAGSQGAAHYTADNPDYGAVITYHLSESYSTLESERKKEEGKLQKDEKPLTFPDWEMLKQERLQEKPKIWLTIRDTDGNVVRKLNGEMGKGFHRVAWDLRYPAWGAIDIHREAASGRSWQPSGMAVMPGTYTVTLSKEIDGKISDLAGPLAFEVERLYEGALEAKPEQDIAAFRDEVNKMREATSAASITFDEVQKKVTAMQTALSRMAEPPGDLYEELYDIKRLLAEFNEKVYGDPAKRELSEYDYPTVSQRLGVASGGAWNLNYGPTGTQQMCLEIAKEQFKGFKAELEVIIQELIPAFEAKLVAAGAPWMNGMPLK